MPNADTIQALSLYHYTTCPFCVITRRAIDQMGVDVDLRDTLVQPKHRRELVNGGGKAQVPCLRVDTQDGRSHWLYESRDIIDYLRRLSAA